MAEISTNQIMTELRRLQDAANAYRMMRAELEDLQKHFAALGVSYTRAIDEGNPDHREWNMGKSQAYGMAASKIEDILA